MILKIKYKNVERHEIKVDLSDYRGHPQFEETVEWYKTQKEDGHYQTPESFIEAFWKEIFPQFGIELENEYLIVEEFVDVTEVETLNEKLSRGEAVGIIKTS